MRTVEAAGGIAVYHQLDLSDGAVVAGAVGAALEIPADAGIVEPPGPARNPMGRRTVPCAR